METILKGLFAPSCFMEFISSLSVVMFIALSLFINAYFRNVRRQMIQACADKTPPSPATEFWRHLFAAVLLLSVGLYFGHERSQAINAGIDAYTKSGVQHVFLAGTPEFDGRMQTLRIVEILLIAVALLLGILGVRKISR